MRRASLLLFVSACAITEDNLPERYADAYCDQLEACDPGRFESLYEDDAACEADVEAVVQDVMAVFELLDCELDGGAAKDEIQAMRGAECDAFVNGDREGGGEDVWDCP